MGSAKVYEAFKRAWSYLADEFGGAPSLSRVEELIREYELTAVIVKEKGGLVVALHPTRRYG